MNQGFAEWTLTPGSHVPNNFPLPAQMHPLKQQGNETSLGLCPSWTPRLSSYS